MTRSRRAAWLRARFESAAAWAIGSLDPLDDGAGGEGAAAAHGDEGRAPVAALELVKGGGDEAAAGGAHGMAEGDGPAVDVDLVHVGLDHTRPRQGDRREGFVDLEDVDVVLGHPRLLQHTFGRGRRTV